MTKLTALRKDKSWQKQTDAFYALSTSIVPLAARELPYAALEMPLAFAPEGNGYTLVAFLSFLPGQNLFVSPEGKWMGKYVPAIFRAYPFRLVDAPGKEGMVLRVEEDAVQDAGEGEPFFDENGELAQPVKDILEFLKEFEQNRMATEAAVAVLAEAGVITQWNLKVGDKPVKGIFRIDEAALNSLDDETFLRLRKAQALPVAYAQLLSMGNIRVLQRLAEYHDKAAPPKVDIEGLFGEDDIFKFQ